MNLIIGIDPDLEESGIAISLDGRICDICMMNFPNLIRYFYSTKNDVKKVVIEAGWLNKKSNWHNCKSVAIAGRIGKNVGENHATGKLIAQMCEDMGLDVQLVRPTAKKLNAEEFKRITGISQRTNQEQRDSAMLIWGMK